MIIRYRIVRIQHQDQWYYALEGRFLGLFPRYKDTKSESHWWTQDSAWFEDCLTRYPEVVRDLYNQGKRRSIRRAIDNFREKRRKKKASIVPVNLDDLDLEIAQSQLSGEVPPPDYK